MKTRQWLRNTGESFIDWALDSMLFELLVRIVIILLILLPFVDFIVWLLALDCQYVVDPKPEDVKECSTAYEPSTCMRLRGYVRECK